MVQMQCELCDSSTPGVVFDCDGYSINGIDGYAGVEVAADDVTVQNCHLSHWSYGIFGEITCNGVLVSGNNITNSTGNGIELVRCDNADVIGNNVTIASTGIYMSGRLGILAYNATVSDNIVRNVTDAGIWLGEPFSIFSYGTVNYEVLRNTVLEAATALREYGGSSNQISHNYFGSDGLGIEMDLFVVGDYLYNNTIRAENVGLSIIESDSVDFNETRIIMMGSDPTVFSIGTLSSGDIRLFDTYAQANGTTWFEHYDLFGNDVNFTRLTLDSAGGSLYFEDSFLAPDDTSIDDDDINFSNQLVFLNSTSASFLNLSTNITFYAPGLTTPMVFVDTNDNGTFEACSAPRCTNVDYSAGEFRVTVSGFTSYQVIDIASDPEAIPEFGTLVWMMVAGLLIGVFVLRRKQE